MKWLHYVLAPVIVGFLALTVAFGSEEDERARLQEERERLRELIREVQEQVEAEAREGRDDRSSEAEEEPEWVEQEDWDEERAEEWAEEFAERLEQHAEEWGEEFEERMEEIGQRWEEWAEEHGERWEEWAEGYGRSWEEWAEGQEAKWEEWAEEYSHRWEEWAEQLESGDIDKEQLSELIERNVEMLGEMPLAEIYDQLLRTSDQLEKMPLESIADLEDIVRESLEQALQGLEEGVAKTDLEGLGESLEHLRQAMEVKKRHLDKAAAHRLREANELLERGHLEAAQKMFERARARQARQLATEGATLESLLRDAREARSKEEVIALIEDLSRSRESQAHRESEVDALREEIDALRAEIEALRDAIE